MPESYSNDIDFGVLSKNLDIFLRILKEEGDKYNFQLTVIDLRLDVLKLAFISKTERIDIDIWSTFNYAGLYYLNHNKIIRNYRYYNGIKVLHPENELALSYLKELLHMSRLREDKVKGLKDKIKSPNKEPFHVYFSESLRKEFILSIQQGKIELNYLARRARLSLLIKNITKNGFFRTIRSIFDFAIIRLKRAKLIIEKEKVIHNLKSNKKYS